MFNKESDLLAQVKSGSAAGTVVPLASIVVTDQSGVEMKVVLWRRSAFWVLTVSPGDILLITGTETHLSSCFRVDSLSDTPPAGCHWSASVVVVSGQACR